MATIIFFPHPEYGHLNPPLKLAKALQRRGHRVCYMSLADFENYIRSQGLDYIAILEKRCPKGYLKRRMEDKTTFDVDNLDLIVSEAAGVIGDAPFDLFSELESDFSRILADFSPDLLILDFKLRDLAAITVNKLRMTTAILSVTLIDLSPVNGEDSISAPYSDLPELFLCPREFDFPSKPKRNRSYIECSLDLERKEMHAFPWNEITDDRPMIYCSLGSHPYQYRQSHLLFRTLIDVLAGKPEWRLVVAIGTRLRTGDFHHVPDNVVVVNWAPQLQVLEKAAVMITHGGLGAVKECIFFGVPMIVFPCRWDQPHNAARIMHHGLGLRGDVNAISAPQIRYLIDAVTGSHEIKRRVATMSRIFRQIEDSGIGVRTVEGILRDCDHRQFSSPGAAPRWTDADESGLTSKA